MDDLLEEFLAETAESLEIVDTKLVTFERNPTDSEALNCVFRLIHTIKGTCGFLGLPLLESVAHAGETLLGRFRDGSLAPTSDAVCLVLGCVDQTRELLAHLQAHGVEPENGDAAAALIARLQRAAEDPDDAQDNAVSKDALPDNGPPSPAEVPDTAEDAVEPSNGARPAGDPAEQVRAAQTIRVRLDVLEDLMTMVSELVLTRNQLLQIARKEEDSLVSAPLQKLSSVTAELQETVMKTRMQPIGSAWKKLPRLVRDAACEVGKSITLVTEGEATELDRQVIDLIADPLAHMVRNACDHGIEDAATRSMRGKPEAGTVRICAYHEGGHILIELSDDGGGLDPERIRARAIDRKLIDSGATMSDAQLLRLIFEPGFSTVDKVTHLSGRGVGMDVVRTNIELIGGTVEVASDSGKGSLFTIKIPLTLAIISALIIGVRGHKLALPQLAIIELVKIGRDYQVESIDDAPVLRLRERLLPLVFLSDFLGLEGESDSRCAGFVVVMDTGSASFGLVVDDVFDPEEIVVKPISHMLGSRAAYSGATILGDGAVSLILDPMGLAQAIRGVETSHRQQISAAASVETQRASTAMLIFRAGNRLPCACFLNLVSRLEILDASEFAFAATGPSVQYCGSLMPLTSVGDADIPGSGKVPVIVFGHDTQQTGVVVLEICDIVEEAVRIEIGSEREGLIGTAVIREQTTEIMDVAHYLNKARPGWLEGAYTASPGRMRDVLLIESHPFFRNLLDPLLTAAGYRVATADGQIEARRLIESGTSFAAVLADMDELQDAPGLDEIIQRCKAAIIPLSSNQSDSKTIAKTDRRALLSALEDAIRLKADAA